MKKGIISLCSALIGVGVGVGITGKILSADADKWKGTSNKHLDLFLMMNQWVRLKQEGKKLSEFFEQNNYKNIAIYGMSYAGETLVNELKDSEICIKYAIDKNADEIYSDMTVITMDNDLQYVDAIVVTAITFFDEIEAELRQKINCPILSLEEILSAI